MSRLEHAIRYRRRHGGHGLLDMSKGIGMLHVWHRMLRWYRLFSGVGMLVFLFILVIVIIAALVLEVGWSFVLMGLSILAPCQQIS